MSTRLMAKTFDVERSEKGTGLQTKINAFTNGKSIGDIHSISLFLTDTNTKALLLYSDEGDESLKRVYAKVVEGSEIGSSELQTKVNSFTKGKDLDVKATGAFVDPDGSALVVVLYTKEGVEESDTVTDSATTAEPVTA